MRVHGLWFGGVDSPRRPPIYFNDCCNNAARKTHTHIHTPIVGTMAEATYYIDEDVGHDTSEQTGDQELPYKSLGYAVLTRGEKATFLTRKSVTGEVAEGADA